MSLSQFLPTLTLCAVLIFLADRQRSPDGDLEPDHPVEEELGLAMDEG